MTFSNLNLHENLLKAVDALHFNEPTDIQKEVIPIILDEKDLIASAHTGAGKTLAYVLPSLHRLLEKPARQGIGPRVLVLTPTRELADQVSQTVQKVAKFTSLRQGAITGGVPYPAQERLLRKPLDFLAATPGRLMDHMNRGRVDFGRLELVILDEADRMLDMGFVNDIEQIIEPMPEDRQMLLFSATIEGEVKRIANRFLRHPVRVQLNTETKPPVVIEQRLHQTDNYNHKRAILNHILSESSVFQAIVFTATKRGAEELADELYANQIECAALHGDMKQSKRSRTLDKMRAGRLRVLIATDVAARGIDVKSITHVINFDFPKSVEDYIHRVGRTGRCGEAGTAISLVGPKDWSQVSMLERTTKQKLERVVISGLEPKVAETRSHNASHSHRNRSHSGGQRERRPSGQRERNHSGHRERNSHSGQRQRSHSGQLERQAGQRERRPLSQHSQSHQPDRRKSRPVSTYKQDSKSYQSSDSNRKKYSEGSKTQKTFSDRYSKSAHSSKSRNTTPNSYSRPNSNSQTNSRFQSNKFKHHTDSASATKRAKRPERSNHKPKDRFQATFEKKFYKKRKELESV